MTVHSSGPFKLQISKFWRKKNILPIPLIRISHFQAHNYYYMNMHFQIFTMPACAVSGLQKKISVLTKEIKTSDALLLFKDLVYASILYAVLCHSAISKIRPLRTRRRVDFKSVLMKNALTQCGSADILGVYTFFHPCQADSEDSRAPLMDNLTHATKLISWRFGCGPPHDLSHVPHL